MQRALQRITFDRGQTINHHPLSVSQYKDCRKIPHPRQCGALSHTKIVFCRYARRTGEKRPVVYIRAHIHITHTHLAYSVRVFTLEPRVGTMLGGRVLHACARARRSRAGSSRGLWEKGWRRLPSTPLFLSRPPVQLVNWEPWNTRYCLLRWRNPPISVAPVVAPARREIFLID